MVKISGRKTSSKIELYGSIWSVGSRKSGVIACAIGRQHASAIVRDNAPSTNANDTSETAASPTESPRTRYRATMPRTERCGQAKAKTP
jgi:hypothetical protein